MLKFISSISNPLCGLAGRSLSSSSSSSSSPIFQSFGGIIISPSLLRSTQQTLIYPSFSRSFASSPSQGPKSSKDKKKKELGKRLNVDISVEAFKDPFTGMDPKDIVIGELRRMINPYSSRAC